MFWWKYVNLKLKLTKMNSTFGYSGFSTPKTDDFSAELRQMIHDNNILTVRTRTKLITELDNVSAESKEEKRENIRKKALEEIYTSEISYLDQLNKVIVYFMQPLKCENFLPQCDFNTVFGNIETIYNVNGELLAELKNDLENVACAFLKFAPFFKLYSFYAYDYKKALSILQNIETSNLEFKKFLEKQESCDEVQAKLASLLITPIQRVPRYRLLLKQVLDHTLPTHPYFKKIIEALKEVERTAEHINSLVEEHENIERMLELQRSLLNNYPCIIKPGRRLLKEGTLMKMSRKRNRGFPRHFVLMSDILMYCKIMNTNSKVCNNTLQCCCILPLNKCKIERMLKSTSFKLTCQQEHFVLYSDDSKTTESWIQALKNAIIEYVECRKTLRKDSSRRQPIRKKHDIEFDYLGLSPGLLRGKRKFQDFDDIFYVHKDENLEDNKKLKWFQFKRPISSVNSSTTETPPKRVKFQDDSLIDKSELNQHVETRIVNPNDSDNNPSKLYDILNRIKNSVKNFFTLK